MLKLTMTDSKGKLHSWSHEAFEVSSTTIYSLAAGTRGGGFLADWDAYSKAWRVYRVGRVGLAGLFQDPCFQDEHGIELSVGKRKPVYSGPKQIMISAEVVNGYGGLAAYVGEERDTIIDCTSDGWREKKRLMAIRDSGKLKLQAIGTYQPRSRRKQSPSIVSASPRPRLSALAG
jgi:hypothetical protein